MILVDTSIWVDHLRRGDATLARLLLASRVVTHPFIVGELALGILRQREIVLGALHDLPRVTVASDSEVLAFVEESELPGSGIGYVDAHLLAATKLMPGTSIWTRDRRLSEVADGLGVAASIK